MHATGSPFSDVKSIRSESRGIIGPTVRITSAVAPMGTLTMTTLQVAAISPMSMPADRPDT